MQNVLIADIGATNVRIATVGADERPENMVKFRGNEVRGIDAAIARFLDTLTTRPTAAVLAIAAPVGSDAVTMTNRPWSFRLSDLAKRFGWRSIRAVNDFEAVGWSLQHLVAADVQALGRSSPHAQGVRVVFGPGTGLGVAALVPTPTGDIVVPTEGGHVTFGPASAEEEPVFARLREEFAPVSAEAVLSGPGLERLHRALHGKVLPLRAAEVVERALVGDPATLKTVETFVQLFGRFAGDLALTFRATGGVYAAGGVARRIATFLDRPDFRAAFEKHPPYAGLLKTIPTTLITLEEPGLLGCAALAARL